MLFAGVALLVACKGGEEQRAEPAAASEAAPEPAPVRAEPGPAPQPEARGEVAQASVEISDAATALADGLDAQAYEADLRFIAATRPPGSAHWQAVQDRCAEALAAAGFSVERLRGERVGVSVVGRKPGRDPKLPALVVGAHYDHIEDCPGADDNASGTAAVLAIARTLAPRSWDRTLIIACWDEEETGLYGSQRWADQAVADGESIGLYMNFDAMAYADSSPNSQTLPPGMDLMFAEQVAELERRQMRGDFIAVLADDAAGEAARRYHAHAERLGLLAAVLEIPGVLKNSKPLAELRRSDHASFWKHDIPAMFLSDTANYRTDTYHCGARPDTVETLDLEFAVKVTRAATGTLADML